MKDIATALFAVLLVGLSLVALMSDEISWEDSKSVLTDNPQRVSDLGLRFVFNR